jgi:hypothetical protein
MENSLMLRGVNLAGQITPGKKSFRTLSAAKEAMLKAEADRAMSLRDGIHRDIDAIVARRNWEG